MVATLRIYTVFIGQRILRYQAMLLGLAILGSLIFGRFNFATIGYYWALIGGANLAFSVVSLFGGVKSTRSFQYQYGMSIGENTVDRTNRLNKELRGIESFVMSSFIQALVAMLCGFALSSLA